MEGDYKKQGDAKETALREIAAEKIRKLLELRNKLSYKLGNIIPKFKYEYSGEQALGIGTEMNSPFTVHQLVMALAIHADNPHIKKILEDDSITPITFDPRPLAEHQVLKGGKILDLGCSYPPSFARTARCLGAEVYTLDVIPYEKMEEKYGAPTRLFKTLQEQADFEAKYHLQLDLRKPQAMQKIIESSGGNFDLVTSSHLESGARFQGQEIYPPGNIKDLVMPLLKPGGIYYNASKGIGRKEDHYLARDCMKIN